jgi:hypothetical protein
MWVRWCAAFSRALLVSRRCGGYDWCVHSCFCLQNEHVLEALQLTNCWYAGVRPSAGHCWCTAGAAVAMVGACTVGLFAMSICSL